MTRAQLVIFAAAFASLGLSAVARADLVPPEPTNCPPGEVGISSHHGAECVKPAPKDCPPGWAGRVGGVCLLKACLADQYCDEGEDSCQEAVLCLKPDADGYYEVEDEKAAPGENAPRQSKPIARYDAINLCAKGIPCDPPNICRREKICAPRGKRAEPYRGPNVQSSRVAQTPVPASTAQLDPTTPIAAPTGPAKRGCGGCGAGGDASSLGVGALLVLAVVIARRRAQEKRP